MPELLLLGDVARILVLSVATIRALDDELAPRRTVGGVRVYDGRRVEAVRARRAQVAKERAKLRPGARPVGRPRRAD